MNMIARTRDHETVFLALHPDGRLAEYGVDELRCDLLEAQMRIATNEQANQDLFAEVAADAA